MGFFDSIINAFSQGFANRTNVEMTRETNETNEAINQANITAAKQMFNQQMAYNYDMWQKQNEYNSPSAQKERLKAAGINPYAMLDGGSAGTAGSSTAPSYSQPSMIPMQPGHVDPVRVSLGDEINMVQGYKMSNAQVDKTRAEASVEWQDANFRRTQQTLDILTTLSNIRSIDAKTKGQILQNYFDGMTIDSRIQRAELDNDFVKAQTDLVRINKQLEEARLPYIGQEAAARIDNIIQDTALKYQKALSESTNRAYTRKLIEKAGQEIEESIARTLMTNKQAFNIPMLTQKQADEISKLYYEAKREELEGSKWDSWSKELDWNKSALELQGLEEVSPAMRFLLGNLRR